MEISLGKLTDGHPYLDQRWHDFYQAIGQRSPTDPRYVDYLKEKAAVERGEVGQVEHVEQAESQQVLDGLEQSDDSYVKEMLALAEKNDIDSELEFSTNDDVCRAFADGKI